VAIHYPVDLPKFAKYSFVAYPILPSATERGIPDPPVQVRLETNRGKVVLNWTNTDPKSYPSARQIFTFIDKQDQYGYLGDPSKQIEGIYGESTPVATRSAAYGRLYAVVLGSGVSRLSDEAIAALKEYALGGGRLVFIGGSDPQAASDPRWKDLCPVTSLRKNTLSTCTISLPGFSQTLSGHVPVAEGDLANGAYWLSKPGSGKDAIVEAACKPYGAGSATFIGISPFDSPLTADTDLNKIMLTLIDAYDGQSVRDQLLSQAGQTPPTYGRNGEPRFERSSSVPLDHDDPFSVTLPSSEMVATILLIYIILVAPVNLLLLKKLGKSQAAWLTAPVLCLAFAAVFFHFAGSLYSATLSKKVNGVIVVDSQSPTGLVFANSQLFFPKSGSYNLNLSGVEFASNDDRRDWSRSEGGPFNTGDTLNEDDQGNISIPSLESTNLGFHQIDFSGRVSGPWLTANAQLTDNKLTGSVTNQSKYPLKDAVICAHGMAFPLGVIKAGETKLLNEEGHALGSSGANLSNTVRAENMDISAKALSQDRLVLTGTLDGFSAGPQIGSAVRGSALTLYETLGVYK
jgi:hypothetical protein